MAGSANPVELIFERDPATLARVRTAMAPAMIFPLETTTLELELGRQRSRLDRSSFALVPVRARYRLVATSPAPKVVTLIVFEAARARAHREYAPHLELEAFAAVLGASRVLPRTRWVDELVHRYLFEREICERHDTAAARFLETELTKELYFLGEEQRGGLTRAPVIGEASALVERARAAIEATLFEPFSMAALARHCHASESTLLRAFRRAFGMPPGTYVRERRLDEALGLLESGRYSVGEVAARVGYARQAAFAAAFHKKFHVPPSRIVRVTSGSPLPPHGRPPRRPGRVTGR